MTQTRTTRDGENPYAAGLPVAIYARADGPDADADRSIRVQLVACRELAAVSGLVVSHELVDSNNPVRDRPRQGYAELLELLTSGRVGGVIVYDAERFTRRQQELLALAEALESSGAALHTVTGIDFDLGTAEGRATLRLLAGVYVCVSDDRDRAWSEGLERQEQAARAALARLGGAR